MLTSPSLVPLKRDRVFARRKLDFDQELVWEKATSPRTEKTGAEGVHWWLLHKSVPVAYCKTISYPQEQEKLILSDIEVHVSARRVGWCRKITAAVAEQTSEILYSTGNWTEDGALALQHLPVAGGFEAGVYYGPQVFVADWTQLLPRYW